MIFDYTFLFSDAQELTETGVSENVIDLGVDRDIGKGIPVPLRVQVVEDFAGATGLTVEVETSETEDFASSETISTSGVIDAADLVAGYVFMPQYMPWRTKRYLRLSYTVAGTGTAGAVTAGVVAGHQAGF